MNDYSHHSREELEELSGGESGTGRLGARLELGARGDVAYESERLRRLLEERRAELEEPAGAPIIGERSSDVDRFEAERRLSGWRAIGAELLEAERLEAEPAGELSPMMAEHAARIMAEPLEDAPAESPAERAARLEAARLEELEDRRAALEESGALESGAGAELELEDLERLEHIQLLGWRLDCSGLSESRRAQIVACIELERAILDVRADRRRA